MIASMVLGLMVGGAEVARIRVANQRVSANLIAAFFVGDGYMQFLGAEQDAEAADKEVSDLLIRYACEPSDAPVP